MQHCVLLFLLILASWDAVAQDGREVLKRSYQKCLSVQNGQYTLISHQMGFLQEDTVISMTQCAFKKTQDDPNFPVLFHTRYWYQGKLRSRTLNTGEVVVSMSEQDSVALVRTHERWAEEFSHVRFKGLYPPLVGRAGHSHYAPPSSFVKGGQNLQRLPDDTVRNRLCHVVQVTNIPEENAMDSLKQFYQLETYWINQSDDIPVQYVYQMTGTLFGDTVHQYTRYDLKSYALDTILGDSVFTSKSIPEYYAVKEYVQKTFSEPLPRKSIAPDWTLPLLDGGQMTLSELRGKVVLLDFFFKACGLCLLSYPEMQSLHETYGEHGLVVIGVNPVDKPGSGLKEFAERKGMRYPIVVEAGVLEEKYRISGYPTAYLIDADGKVIYCHSGYGFQMKEKLEELIRKELKIE